MLLRTMLPPQMKNAAKAAMQRVSGVLATASTVLADASSDQSWELPRHAGGRLRGKDYLAGVRANFKLRADRDIDLGCIKEFRAERFPKAGPTPWLDRDDAAQQVSALEGRRDISHEQARLARKWISEGYVVLERAFAPEEIDAAWAGYERDVKAGKVVLERDAQDPHPGRFLNPHFVTPEVDDLLHDERLTSVAGFLMGRDSIPFQTISSHAGSQQGAHSDSIHMTTYPLGYLTACWIAMEDIHPDSGPLVYYPGSHREPFVFSSDVGITPEDFRKGGYAEYHKRYEPAIRDVLARGGHPERHFMAKKGDVLFWHANLIHGGSPRRDFAFSRKAIVCHYYADGCVCYHDLAADPSAVHGGAEDLPVCGASHTPGS